MPRPQSKISRLKVCIALMLYYQKNGIEIMPIEKTPKNVDIMPQFPGGEYALRSFMTSNVRYPENAQRNSIQGKVFVNFVVDRAGNAVNAKVVRRIHPLLDAEAVRVVQSLPQWIPAQQNGRNVRVSYTVPVNFVLQ